MKKKKTKRARQPRNYFAVHAHNRMSAGPMGEKKGRKANKKYAKISEELEEALESLWKKI